MKRLMILACLAVSLFSPLSDAFAAPSLPCRRIYRLPVDPFPGGGGVPAYQLRAGDTRLVPTPEDLASDWAVKAGPGVQKILAEVGKDPYAAYRWVRDRVEYLPYFGVKAGAEGTAWGLVGNDFDQASLLAALLRSQGISTRFVYGVVRVEAKVAADWCGMASAEEAYQFLVQGGVPVRAILVSEIVRYLEVNHCWLEARVPLTNPGNQGPGEGVWVPLDPSFKRHSVNRGQDLFTQLNFQQEDFLLDYLQVPGEDSPEDYFRDLLRAKLAEYGNVTSLGDTAWRISVIPEGDGSLPTAMPPELNVLGTIWEEALIPEVYHYRIRLTLWDGHNDGAGITPGDIRVTIPSAFFSEHALTVAYIPATPEDQALADGSPSGSPMDMAVRGEIRLRPQLLVDGKPVGEFLSGDFLESGIPGFVQEDQTIAANIGFHQKLLVETLAPAKDPADTIPLNMGAVERELQVGGIYALGCTGGLVSAGRMQAEAENLRRLQEEGTVQEVFSASLSVAALQYLHKTSLSANSIAALLGVRHFEEPLLMLCGIHPTAGLDPGGVFYDVYSMVMALVSRDGRADRERAFMFLTGLQGSYYEHKVLSDVFQTTAVSAVRILKHMQSLGISPLVLDGTDPNLGATLGGLVGLSAEQKAEILAKVMGQGWKLIIPPQAATLERWTGWGYIIWDPDTGAGGYMISGGLAGGNQSSAVTGFIVGMWTRNYADGTSFIVVHTFWFDADLKFVVGEIYYLSTSAGIGDYIASVVVVPGWYTLPLSIDVSRLSIPAENEWDIWLSTHSGEYSTDLRWPIKAANFYVPPNSSTNFKAVGICVNPSERNTLYFKTLIEEVLIQSIKWSAMSSSAGSLDPNTVSTNPVRFNSNAKGETILSAKVTGTDNYTFRTPMANVVVQESPSFYLPQVGDTPPSPLNPDANNRIYVDVEDVGSLLIDSDYTIREIWLGDRLISSLQEISEPGAYRIVFTGPDGVWGVVDFYVYRLNVTISDYTSVPIMAGATAAFEASIEGPEPEGMSLKWTERNPGTEPGEDTYVLDPDDGEPAMDVDVTPDPETGGMSCNITAHEESGYGWLTVKVWIEQAPTCSRTIIVRIGCNSCGGDACDQPDLQIKSIFVALPLGKGRKGQSAGEIFLKARRPSANLATPARLRLSHLSDEVEIIRGPDGAIRQVSAPRKFIDIVKINDFKYAMRFYRPAARGGKVKGLYTILPNATPTVVWRVDNPDASPDLYNRLKITKIKDGKLTVHEYVWNQELATWALNNAGLQEISKVETLEGSDRVVIKRVKRPADTTNASVSRSTYRTFPWGEQVTLREERVEGDFGEAGEVLTTTTTYYEVAGEARYGKIERQINADGSWARYVYDDQGRKTKDVRPWLNSGIDDPDTASRVTLYNYIPVDDGDAEKKRDKFNPRTVTEQIQGITVGKTFHVYKYDESGNPIEIAERAASPSAAYGDAANERTRTTYYRTAAGTPESGRIKSHRHADGKLDSYQYEYGTFALNPTSPAESAFTPGAGNDIRETVTHGTAASPDGIAYKTTKETSVREQNGTEYLRETYVWNGIGYTRIDWTVMEYDEDWHLVKTTRSNNIITEQSWDCCGLASDTDSRGITKSYTYDGLSRVETETVPGPQGYIITTYTYDGEGRRTGQTVTAGGLVQTTSSNYDLAGRLKTTTDAAGLTTTYGYRNSGRKTTTTRPGGATEITDRYPDGRTMSVTGTGVVPQYYEYGVNPDGTQWTKVYTGSENSPMWVKTTADLLGRAIQTEKPGFAGVEITQQFYDDAGRLVRTSASGMADTLYEYDDLGNRTRTGLDINHNGLLDLASTDRISETETAYAKEGNDWWQKTEQRVYTVENDANPATVGTQKVQKKGFETSDTVEKSISIDVHGNQTVSRTTINRVSKTETRTTDYPDSTIDEVRVSVGGYATDSTSKTGVTVTYDYDALGRGVGATDPRTGRSVTHYNDKGQVEWIEDPEQRRTSYGYDPSTGRKTVQTNALGKATRYAYDLKGQLTHTWGDAAYPVKYDYDPYGRMERMYTYRNDANWSSVTWPTDAGTGDQTTWVYDVATGLLKDKVDAANKAVSYTYAAQGRLQTRTWARTDSGNPLVTTYIYSPDTGELLSVDYSDITPDVAYTYDRLGRQKTVQDALGSRTFEYTAALQPAGEEISGLYSQTLTRNYSTTGVLGRATGFSLGADYSVTYGHEPSTGRFNSMAWNVGGMSGIVTYGYVPNSDLLETLTSPSGQTTTYSYEPHRNLRTRVLNKFNETTISDYGYVYDALGRRTSVTNQGTAFAQPAFSVYGYNDRSELTAANRYLGTDINDRTQPVDAENRGYAYDPIGNRKTAEEAALQLTYTTNQLNQYELINNAVQQAPDYDDDGNLISITEGSVTKQYVFDGENRLISVQPQTPAEGDKKVDFLYDYMGRRVRKQVYSYSGSWTLAADTRFVYDGWNMIRELDATGQPIRSYVWGLDLSQSLQGAGGIGGLLVMKDSSGAYGYLYDANGNVGQLINIADGSIAAHYEYDPYGNTLTASGSLAGANPYRFSTKYVDDETGLVYYGYRYYSSKLGRWLSRDPIGEGNSYSLYLFSGNMPISKIDILGLWKTDVHKDLTMLWARELFIPLETANQIGAIDDQVDVIYSPMNIDNINWSWHFNRATSGDSRLDHKTEEYELAKTFCSQYADYPEGAINHLGRALHPLQDIVAHGDYNRNRAGEATDLVIYGIPFFKNWGYFHNFHHFEDPDDINRDAMGSNDHGIPNIGALRGPYGEPWLIVTNRDVVYSVEYQDGSLRREYTRELTRNLLREFLQYLREQKVGCCKCRRAFYNSWEHND